MGDLSRSDNSNDEVRFQRHESKASVLLEIMLHLTTIIHTFIFAILCLLLYICFAAEWSFFIWHPLLMTIGWWLLASEGILLLRRDNLLSKYLTHQWKIRLHWFVQVIAVSCNIAGFVIEVINKDRNNRNHFTTYHGKFGLTTVLLSVLVVFGGTTALYSAALRQYVRPNLNKALHILFGGLAYIFAIVTFIFALYSTGWFKNQINQNQFIEIVFIVILVITTVWLLVKPLINFSRKIKPVLFRS